ncbi:YggS family pyridoxal phosphate-dependent enzyme [Pseudidiomarina marina]|uniref:Pyridoxal phosphate homeostasis protein n=1 Tax=Pseudidiomarina marina TaxID=502366 RepID=A0A432YIE3_9GAMM|nr:YggS family pyridoxal phosphate-dependent enzyme [Pseudidiomarina marina]PHR64472.1 MAG: YggS family pyridoxal phosphate-dependent enzyme [Idiomarina sp.]RUO60737.1 YggS family pyridoxal phosphate-dependent enzyme [Pseudidiomarina marina]
MNSIAERIKEVRNEIARVCEQYQRKQNSVKLIAVSKTKPAADIASAYHAGQRDFGENYVQEAIAKIMQLSEYDITWHFIGPIQSNKTRDIAEHFAWVHSVDRAKIARRLAQQRPAEMPPLNVLIQVNIDDDQAKSGVAPEEVAELAAVINDLPQIQLRGLMTIPAVQSEPSASASSFAAMQRLFLELQSQYKQVDTLSMGMSADWPYAVAAGATMIRIGTAVFGARVNTPKNTGDPA